MQKLFKQAMRCCKLLITLSVSIALFSISAFGCDVVLKKKAAVGLGNITLKDVAVRYPKDISNFVIGSAPYLNNSVVLSGVYIKSLLLQKGIKVSICGSPLVRVITKGVVLNRERILKIVGLRSGVLVGRKFYILPLGKYTFRSRLNKSDKDLRFYDIEVYKGGKFYKNLSVVIRSSDKSYQIPVASREIEPGCLIKSSDITYGKVSRIPPNALTSKSIIVGRVSLTLIRKGKPFTQSNTKRYKPVRMGDLVKVKVVQGSVIIYTIAKALRGGYDGDIIPIMYLSSKRVRTARVVGRKTVVVQ